MFSAPIPFGYPVGMVPYGGYPNGGQQWGSGQSIQSVGVAGNPQLSNMDANRAIWYAHECLFLSMCISDRC